MNHCLVCGGDEINLLTTINNAPAEAQCFLNSRNSTDTDSITLQLFFCTNCGHVQSDGHLVSYYKNVITASGSSPVVLQSRLEKISNFLIKFSEFDDIHLLDIGSGDYSFIDYIKPLGTFASVTGLENSLAANYSDMQHHAHYLKGYIDNNLFEPTFPLFHSHYQFLTCFNFLEHIPDPYIFLQRLKTYLSSSALVYFTVPSFDFIRRTDCVHEFVADHLSYFSKKSLALLFERCGYTVLECNSINNNNDLEILAQYNPPILPNLCSGFDQLKTDLNSLMNSLKAQRESISFWGAGHRNLTLISQLQYHNIDYIVDSAAFKQGLYSPVSKIMIISPQQFRELPTSCLFISLPGLYNKEVLSFVLSWETPPNHIYFVNENSITPVTK